MGEQGKRGKIRSRLSGLPLSFAFPPLPRFYIHHNSGIALNIWE